MDASAGTLRTIVAAILLASLPSLLQAAPANNEAYYAQDIDAAVANAKRNPVDSEYVGASWYNRSTSRSFPLPKMLNTEMDGEVIEGAMGPTAAGEAAAAQAAQPVRDAALGRQSKRDTLTEGKKKSDNPDDEDEYTVNTSEIYVQEARSENSRVTEIRANVTIKATSRP